MADKGDSVDALVRYPDFVSSPAKDSEEEIARLARQSARLKTVLTIVLSFNALLVSGAITWIALVLHS
jgi:hypothetical protein